MKLLLTICLVFITCQSITDGYRILGVFPLNGRSHWIMMESLMKGLAQRGHQVDVITHFKTTNAGPNYNEILIKSEIGAPTNNITAKEVLQFGSVNLEHLTYMTGYKICELLGLPEIQKVIKNPPKDPPYDLVITELFSASCYLAFGRHLKVPMIGVMSSRFHDWSSHNIGVPDESSYVPNIFSDFTQKMTFTERFINTMTTFYLQYQMTYYTNKQAELVKKHFDMDVEIQDLFVDLSLVLVNSHHSLNGIRPFPQSIIEVGGLHLSIDNNEKLQPEVQKWLDESEHGFVYFTFGSMVRIETFSLELIQAFYKAFENISPVRVLMKVAKTEDLAPGLPKNVMTQSWFAQIPVLKHKNIRAFITHGGLMGTTESVFCGVPMIGIPLFGDQAANIQNYVKRNVAISLGSISEVTEEKLTDALNAILKDPTYMKNVKKLSEMFNDRPQKPMSLATYWVEYVIKNKNILQSPAVRLPWWKRHLLDVYGTIIFAILLVILILIFFIKLTLKLIFKKKSPKSDNLKKKQN